MHIKPLPTAVTVAIAAFFVALSSPATSTLAGMQKGKPQPPPPPPPPSTYSATLGPSIHDDLTSTGNEADYPDLSQDGLESPGHLLQSAADLTGSIAGPNKNGNFIGTIGGTLTGLIISNVDELPDWFDGGNPCQENEVATLRDLGLVGSALSGNLNWRFSELTGSLKGKPRIDWTLDGVIDTQGASCSLVGNSGSSRPQFFPFFEPGSSANDITVTVENSVVDFVGPMTVLKCRVDFTMGLTRVSAGSADR